MIGINNIQPNTHKPAALSLGAVSDSQIGFWYNKQLTRVFTNGGDL